MSRLKILVDEQIGQIRIYFLRHVCSGLLHVVAHLAALLITIQEVPGPLENPHWYNSCKLEIATRVSVIAKACSEAGPLGLVQKQTFAVI